MQRVVMAALLAGALAGVVAFALHMWQTTPLILHAEVFESGEGAHGAAHGTAHGGGTGTVSEAKSEAKSEARSEAGAGDEGGVLTHMRRHAFSLLADMVTAIGFSFLLVGAMALSGRRTDWRQGIVWGLCGYAAFIVAPSLGMAPELPGMVGAELGERQVWWLGAAAATATALALIFFAAGALWKLVAALLVVTPHVIGAPHPVFEPGNVPAELAAQFAVASLVISGLFWMALGGLGGYFYRRFEPSG